MMPTQNPFLFLSNLPNYVSIKLDSSNFVLWNFQITAVLRGFSLFGFVDGTIPCPVRFLRVDSGEISGENPNYMAWVAQDQALLAMINATLSPSALSYVVGQTTSRGVWLTLSRRFTSLSRSNVLDLKLALHEVKKNGDSIEVYLQRIKSLRDNLAVVSVLMSDEEILHITLRGLPPEYHGLRTAIRTRNDFLPLEDLHVLLLSEERALQEHQDSLDTMPNIAMAMAAFRNFSQNSNKGKGVKNSYSNQSSGSQNNKGKAPMNSHDPGASSSNNSGASSGSFFHHNKGNSGNFSGSGNFIASGNCGNFNSCGNFGGYNSGNSVGNFGGFNSGNSVGNFGGFNSGNSDFLHTNGGYTGGSFNGQASSSNSRCDNQHNSGGGQNRQFVNSSYNGNNGRPVCQICNLPGHVALDCYHRMDFSYHGRHPPARLAAMAAITNPENSNYWLTDSGATNHITADISNLNINSEYNGTDEVAIGNGQGLPISHIGQTTGIQTIGSLILEQPIISLQISPISISIQSIMVLMR